MKNLEKNEMVLNFDELNKLDQFEQANIVWSIIEKLGFKDATMEPNDSGYSIELECEESDEVSEDTIIRLYDIDVDIDEDDDEDITVDDIETTLGEMGWSEEDGLTPADFIEERGADFISDECGFCIDGYNWEIVK